MKERHVGTRPGRSVDGGIPPVLVIQHETGAPPTLLGGAATQAGLRLDIRVVDRGDPVPETIGPSSALVVLGGTAGVHDAPDRPYLYRAMDLIREAARRDRPFLGICLGGQLAAEALGGRVHRRPDGFEIGWVTVHTTEAGRVDPVTSVIGSGAEVFQWHEDWFDVPPGAIPVLEAAGGEPQGFRLGRCWALQGHPEVDRATIASWAESPAGRAQVDAAGVRPEDLCEGADIKAASAQRMLHAWCRMVAGMTPRRPGLMP